MYLAQTKSVTLQQWMTKRGMQRKNEDEGRAITCNNPPGLAEGFREGDAREATAAPSPSSAALQTERAWPEADGTQTSAGLDPAAPADTLLWFHKNKHLQQAECLQDSASAEFRLQTKKWVAQHLMVMRKITEERIGHWAAGERESSQAWSRH